MGLTMGLLVYHLAGFGTARVEWALVWALLEGRLGWGLLVAWWVVQWHALMRVRAVTTAAATAIAAAKHLGAEKAETIAYSTSYDKSPGDSFVGYVGVVFR